MIPIIFIIKIAEFDHVLFKQRGHSQGEAATSSASSQIVRMPFAFSLFVTTVVFVDTCIICPFYP